MLRLALRVLRWLVGALALLVGLAGAYLAASLAGAAVPAGGQPFSATGEPGRIYLLTSLLHADIAIPVDETLRLRFGFLRSAGLPLDHPDLRYLVFGWGARDFYLKTANLSDIRPVPTLKAIFGDSAVMHVLAAGDITQAPDAIALTLPPGGINRLIDFIEAGFLKQGSEVDLIEGINYGRADVFFAGTGNFNIFRPCNIWVAEALQKSGLGTGVWTPTTFSLKLGLAWHSPLALQMQQQ